MLLRRREIAKEFFLSSRLLNGINADELAGSAFIFKLHYSVNQREQRVVFAASNVVTGFPLGATLARNDVAAQNFLAAKLFQSQPLRLRIATITR